MSELSKKVDTLVAEINSSKAEIADLKKKVADLESSPSAWAYIFIGASVLGLIVFFISRFKPKVIKKDRGDSLSSQHGNRVSHSGSFDMSKFDTRLRNLESEMKKVTEEIHKINNPVTQSVPSRQETPPSVGAPVYPKVGYAKVDSDNFFTTIYDSNQDFCVFKITFTSESEGKFDIISLDKIKSRNDWQKKVEYKGASIKDASGFQLEEEGVCVKISKDTWEVTKPLKIILKK